MCQDVIGHLTFSLLKMEARQHNHASQLGSIILMMVLSQVHLRCGILLSIPYRTNCILNLACKSERVLRVLKASFVAVWTSARCCLSKAQLSAKSSSVQPSVLGVGCSQPFPALPVGCASSAALVSYTKGCDSRAASPAALVSYMTD